MEARETAIASPTQSAAMGLPETEHGVIYALRDGKPVTLAGDAEFVRLLEATPAALRASIKIPGEKFPLVRSGW